MHNVRHLWTSVRPNGDHRPHDLNRVEIRICDLISDARVLCAITAWAELRVLQLLQDEDRFDPLRASRFTAPELAQLADANDRAVARDGLDAVLGHWRDGRPIRARDWIETELAAMAPLAANLQLDSVLAPLTAVLRDGNEASRWLARQRQGESIRAIISSEARAMEKRDIAQLANVATDRTPLLG
jgi:predicted glutamate--cysteine ligase